MRIAMIASEEVPIPPVRGGGDDAVPTYIEAVASRIGKRHDVTVVGVSDPIFPTDESRENARYVRVDCTPGDGESYLKGVLKFLSSKSFDVILVFNRPMSILPITRVAPDSRLILILHDAMFRETEIAPDLARPVVDVLDRIVTVSKYLADGVRARYPQAAEKVKAVYAGVDLARFAPKGSEDAQALAETARRELQIDKGAVILYVGRLEDGWGLDLLVDAFPLVRVQHPDANLVIVGSRWVGVGDSDDSVRRLWRKARAGREHIRLAGYIPSDQVHPFFAMADMFVSPPQDPDPLADSHYEAMASGTPIITTDRGAGAELTQTRINGIVLEHSEDLRPLAEAIRELLDHPGKAAELGETGRRIVEGRFTWDRVADRIEHVLTQTQELEAYGPGTSDVGAQGTEAGAMGAGAIKRTAASQEISLQSGVLTRPGDGPGSLVDHALVAGPLRRLRARTRGVLDLMERMGAGPEHAPQRVQTPARASSSTRTLDGRSRGADVVPFRRQSTPEAIPEAVNMSEAVGSVPTSTRKRRRANPPMEWAPLDRMPDSDGGNSVNRHQPAGTGGAFMPYAEDDLDRARRRRRRHAVSGRRHRRARRWSRGAPRRRIRITRRRSRGPYRVRRVASRRWRSGRRTPRGARSAGRHHSGARRSAGPRPTSRRWRFRFSRWRYMRRRWSWRRRRRGHGR